MISEFEQSSAEDKLKMYENLIDLLEQNKAQLISQERLSSLGTLSAGIAHEIQNPLNFVNNFSEISCDLLDEVFEDFLQNGSVSDPVELKELLEEVRKNVAKIAEHGKRADNVIRRMLTHARESTEEKESCDLNQLINEYLTLSYKAYRARASELIVDIQKDLEENLPSIKLNAQNVGRTFLNLFNNSFYAMHQKVQGNPNYHPHLLVSTKKEDGLISITVKDNGIGISKEHQENIFQPFFTTKPDGQGTGLGLSLSYEIITNDHQGEMVLESEAGEFTAFTIRLPLA